MLPDFANVQPGTQCHTDLLAHFRELVESDGGQATSPRKFAFQSMSGFCPLGTFLALENSRLTVGQFHYDRELAKKKTLFHQGFSL